MSDLIQRMQTTQQSGTPHVATLMEARDDRVDVTTEATPGVNIAKGCAVLVKQTLGSLDSRSERAFLEEFIRELRS